MFKINNPLEKMLKFGVRKLGIYFSRNSINIVEVEDKRIVSHSQIPLGDSAETLAKTQPSAGVNLSGGMQNTESIEAALRDNKTKAKKVFLGLSPQDQFIRSFQMLMLNRSELHLGIQFEVRKYIPFRTEDLAFDYQYRINKKAGKMDVLFIATTKNNLDNYFAAFNEIGLSVAAVEPASLTLLRILSLTKQFNTGISFALVEAEDQEAEFTIIDKGLACFSREIKLPPLSEMDEASFRMRLTNEIRVSLDYYRRQFAGSNIDKVLFLSKKLPNQAALISGLAEDLKLSVERVELEKDNEANSLQDLNMLKAYALALKDTVKINLTVDLTKKKHAKALVAEEPSPAEKAVAFNVSAIKLPVVLAGLLIIGFAYGFPQIRLSEVNSKLRKLQAQVLESIPPYLQNPTLDTLRQEKEHYSADIAALGKLVTKTASAVTPLWNILPKAIAPGLWLESIDISEANNRRSLHIKGIVYLEGGQEAAPEVVSSFYRKLKGNPDLGDLKLISVSRAQRGAYTVTAFEIAGD